MVCKHWYDVLSYNIRQLIFTISVSTNVPRFWVSLFSIPKGPIQEVVKMCIIKMVIMVKMVIHKNEINNTCLWNFNDPEQHMNDEPWQEKNL